MDEIVKAEDVLSDTEKAELAKWRRTEDPKPLALSVSARMYELFLLGHSCEDIARANENRFPLGMIIDARIRHEWDKHRKETIDKLFNDVGNVVRQRQLEGAMFLTDLMATAHIQFGHKLRKFIQTRDPKDLPAEFTVDSLTKYKNVLHALAIVIGEQKGATVPTVQVITNNATLQEAPKVSPSGNEAYEILKALDRLDQENK